MVWKVIVVILGMMGVMVVVKKGWSNHLDYWGFKTKVNKAWIEFRLAHAETVSRELCFIYRFEH